MHSIRDSMNLSSAPSQYIMYVPCFLIFYPQDILGSEDVAALKPRWAEQAPLIASATAAGSLSNIAEAAEESEMSQGASGSQATHQTANYSSGLNTSSMVLGHHVAIVPSTGHGVLWEGEGEGEEGEDVPLSPGRSDNHAIVPVPVGEERV